MHSQLKRIGDVLKPLKLLAVAAVFLSCGTAFAQATNQRVDREPVAVLEFGASTNWNVKGGGSSFGPNFAVEFTPIENWLEIEAGVTPLFSSHSTEWDTDVLFKKPWTLSRKAEFMFGLGPEWIHTTSNNVTANSLAGEVVGDFMFWPSRKHEFGWYLEPSYDYAFAHGHEQSIGITGGLLIGIP